MYKIVKVVIPSACNVLSGDDLFLFNQLSADYKMLPDPPRNPKADTVAKEIVTNVEQTDIKLTLNDLDTLEYAVLILTPIDRLRRESWSKRERFGRVAGPRLFDLYLQSKPPDPLTADEALLRADLEQIVSETHQLRNVIPALERRRTKLSGAIANITLTGVFIVFFLYLLALYLHQLPTWLRPQNPGLLGTLALSALMGAIGGCVSVMRRLFKATTSSGVASGFTLTSFPEEGNNFSLLLAPLYGAIFGVLLCIIFMSGLVQGSLFPEFDFKQGFTIDNFLTAHPVKLSGFFSLLVWTFIAGFAESLVPDMLDRLIAQAKAAETGPVPASAVNPVTPPTAISVKIEPAAVQLTVGEKQHFTATVTGTDNRGVTWSVQEGQAGGSVEDSVYIAPNQPGTYHIIAKSQADTSKQGTAEIVVRPPTASKPDGPDASGPPSDSI